jgi:surfeit locus 1 family protein
MKHPRLLLLLVVLACALLVALGNWQVKRLHWKQAMLARIEAAIKAPPVPYRRHTETRDERFDGDGSFERVTATGRFDHGGERHVYALRDGRPGYLVFTPLLLDGEGYRVFVDRGFVEGPAKDASRLAFERPAGPVTVSGIIRNPETPGPFDPAPDRKRGIWYSADLYSMDDDCGTAAFDCQFFIEADTSNNVPGSPRGRDPADLLAAIPNNHLGYAITWFGLALALVAVYGFFVYGERRRD